mmetsp:Transcript_16532/g.51741  ORF Transcript_16532/g.51741 Transcript_16532/m.51741 type:complete len:375 (+) Transcript_16532:140-1264(+)
MRDAACVGSAMCRLGQVMAFAWLAGSIRRLALLRAPTADSAYCALRCVELVAVVWYADWVCADVSILRGPGRPPRRRELFAALFLLASHVGCVCLAGARPTTPAARHLVDAALVSPVLEELLFRGVLLGTADRPTSRRARLAAQALLFALGHGLNRGEPRLVACQVGLALVSGFAYGLEAIARRSLWTVVVCHAASNAASLVFFAEWRAVPHKLASATCLAAGYLVVVCCADLDLDRPRPSDPLPRLPTTRSSRPDADARDLRPPMHHAMRRSEGTASSSGPGSDWLSPFGRFDSPCRLRAHFRNTMNTDQPPEERARCGAAHRLGLLLPTPANACGQHCPERHPPGGLLTCLSAGGARGNDGDLPAGTLLQHS